MEAFAGICKDFPEMGLVLVGKEDPSYHDVRDIIIRRGLQDRVKLTGFVDDSAYLALLHGAK